MSNDLGSLLWDCELSLFKVSEQISSGQVFHDDVDIVLVFKDVEQSDDVRVLAHLEDLNFSALKLYVRDCHFLLGHDLNGNTLACLLMNTLFNKAKLSLAQGVFDVIEVIQTRVTNDFLDSLDPFLFFFKSKKVVGSDLIGWENQFEWVESSRTVQMLLWFVLDEDSNQIVHAFVFVLMLVSVDVQFLA
jgi:hypothetical protein